MRTNIKSGDQVRVEWENLEPIIGCVHYTPSEPGDSFVIEVKGSTNRLVYVQNFARMTRLNNE